MLDCTQDIKDFPTLKKLKIYFDRKDFMHTRQYTIKYWVISSTEIRPQEIWGKERTI